MLKKIGIFFWGRINRICLGEIGILKTPKNRNDKNGKIIH